MSTSSTRSRALVALVGLLAIVVTVNATRTYLVPDDWHLPYNMLLATAAMGVAVAAGLNCDDLGLSRARLSDGLRLGAITFGAISAVVIIAGLLGAVTDDRVDAGLGGMLLRVLVVIPVGTVIVEELLFRSALHGLLSRVLTPLWTVVAGSVLFGLWHVLPAANGGAVSSDAVSVGSTWLVVGTFVATTVAGALFIWLRERSGSVAAPMLAHLATNSTTYAVAWFTMR